MSNETTQVQVRLKKDTMDRLAKISTLNGRNRTQTIADAVQLLDRISGVVDSGGHIYIEENGKKTEIKFIGL